MKESEDERQLSEPDADKAVVGWGSIMMAGFIAAAVISLRRRLTKFQRPSSQGNSSGPGASSRQSTDAHGQTSGNQQHSKTEQERGEWPNFRQDQAETRRLWEEHVEEMERLRRRQEAFERERMRTKRNYESWHERHGDKWEWRWHGNRWEWQGEAERRHAAEGRDEWWRDKYGKKTGSQAGSQATPSPLSKAQHYAALGLDVTRSKPYTQAEIKAAFRAKAMEFHPDQNQGNEEAAEEKFRHVMEAYSALRSKP
ncbi:hypothetical protein R1sor_002966 [Riccia sorocarpa]|uniref:J domain-containing protein n=1 Tax=Riccia sorocarpa TaxID=122646 RepID=A0ABD3H312_9MARC